MILLSVGTQLPFDRLVQAVDEWAVLRDRSDISAQIGNSEYRAARLTTFNFMDQNTFETLQQEASALIAHAGMGSILTALQLGKPLIVMPRNSAYGEHRNNHQFATAKSFAGYPGIFIAADREELFALLDDLPNLSAGAVLSNDAPLEFIDKLHAFIVDPERGSKNWYRRFRRFVLAKRPGSKWKIGGV